MSGTRRANATTSQKFERAPSARRQGRPDTYKGVLILNCGRDGDAARDGRDIAGGERKNQCHLRPVPYPGEKQQLVGVAPQAVVPKRELVEGLARLRQQPDPDIVEELGDDHLTSLLPRRPRILRIAEPLERHIRIPIPRLR